MSNIESKNTESKAVPELRFPDFDSLWEPKRIGDFVELVGGLTYTPDNLSDQGLLVLRSSNVQNSRIDLVDTVYVDLDIDPAKKTKVGDIVLCVRNGSQRLIGKSALVKSDIENATHGAFMTALRGEETSFVFQLLQTDNFFREVRKNLGATINSINGADLRRFKFLVPTSPIERGKIASFHSALDEKIALLEQKKVLLEEYKKGCMQQIFSGQIRFKDDHGRDFESWERKKLNRLLFEPKERNRSEEFSKNDVLSVSGEHGCVNQIDLLGRSYAGESILEYHVVRHGDVVYTKSPLKRNPFGIIKANKGRDGIVSTLYAVYRPTKEASADYLDYYFQLDDNLNKYLRPIVRKGAKNDMKVNNSDVLGDHITVPSLLEQTKIVGFFRSIDKKIDLARREIDMARKFKTGLLQKMLV